MGRRHNSFFYIHPLKVTNKRPHPLSRQTAKNIWYMFSFIDRAIAASFFFQYSDCEFVQWQLCRNVVLYCRSAKFVRKSIPDGWKHDSRINKMPPSLSQESIFSVNWLISLSSRYMSSQLEKMMSYLVAGNCSVVTSALTKSMCGALLLARLRSTYCSMKSTVVKCLLPLAKYSVNRLFHETTSTCPSYYYYYYPLDCQEFEGCKNNGI